MIFLTSLARFRPERDVLARCDDALGYVEALRTLSTATGNHRVDIAGLQILFWSDSAEGDAFLSGALGAVSDYWYYRSSPIVRAWLDRLHGDRFGAAYMPRCEGPFNVLGLSQSESPPVIRFWITDALPGLPGRVRAFWDDLRFGPGGEPPQATILDMVQAASFAEDIDKVAPRLVHEILLAMLSGTDFPPRLLLGIVNHIRLDGQITRQRAATLKAVLARRERLAGGPHMAPAELDPEALDPAYLLGRLVAVSDAIWKLGGAYVPPSACPLHLVASAPALTAFALTGLARLRLTGVGAKNRPLATVLKRQMDDITRRLRRRLPAHLSPEGQARFVVGLYQQCQAVARS